MAKNTHVSKVVMAPGWQDEWRDQLHGVSYMENFTTLLLLRAVRLKKELKISTGMEEAGKFGDVAMQIDVNGQKHHQLIHFRWEISQKRLNITTYALTSTEKNAPFGLVGYFNAFRKIKNQFFGNGNEISDLVIFTNGKIIWPVKQSVFGISLSMWDSFYQKKDGVFFKNNENVLGSTLLWLRRDSNIRKLWARFLKEKVEIKDDDLEKDIETFLDKICISECLSETQAIKERINQELMWFGVDKTDMSNAYSFILEKVLEWRKSGQKYHLNTVDGSCILGELKSLVKLIEFGVEKPVKNFSGRSAELQEIISKCKTNNRLEMVITGVEGIGKTELAKKFATVRDCGFHCIFWMKGDRMEALIDSFKELAYKKLNITIKGKDGKEKDFRRILQEINEHLSGRRCLLIIDNVLYKGQASDRNNLKKFLSLLAFKPLLLMTSRHDLWEGYSILRLNEFKKEEAVEILKKSISISESFKKKLRKDIKKLRNQLNNYPLALKMAVAYINMNPGSISSFSETFDRIFADVKTSYANVSRFCNASIIETFRITMIAAFGVIMEQLQDEMYGLAEKCMQIISFMRPEEIFVPDVIACFEKEERKDVMLCLKRMGDYGILNCEDTEIKISETLQSFVRSQISKDNEIQVLEKILSANSIKNMSHLMFTWEYVCKHEDLVGKYSHIPALILKDLNEEEMYDEGYEFGKKNVQLLSKFLPETDNNLINASKQLADITYHYGEEEEALDFYQNVFIKLKKSQGESSTETVLFRKKIASLLFEMEKYNESLSMFEEMLECLMKTLPRSDHEVLRAKCFKALNLAKLGKKDESERTLHDIYSCLKVIQEDSESLKIKRKVANIFFELKNYEESLSIYRDIYAGFERLQGAKHLDSLNAQCKIAMILGNLGENVKSLNIYQNVYASLKEVVGDHHPDTLSTGQSIVSLLNDLEKNEESLKMSDVLFKSSVMVLGKKDPVTLKIGVAIALSLRKLLRFEESLKKYNEIYPVMVQFLGEDDPLTLNTGSKIASLLFEMKKFKDSHDFYKKIYPLLKRSLGEIHLDVLDSGLNYSKTFIALGKYKEGHELCNDIYLFSKRILGDEHPGTLRSGCVVGMILNQLGRSKESLEILEENCKVMKNVFGDNNVETLNARCNIASVLILLQKFEESFKIYKEVFCIKKSLFGKEHPEVFSIECQMAACMYEMGKINESLSMYRELLSRMRMVCGENNMDVLNVKCKIAFTLRELGRYEDSLNMYKEAYNQVKTVLGVEEAKTLDIRSNIALTEEKLGKPEKSLPNHMEIYGIMKKVLGEEHPTTIDAYENVAETLLSVRKCKSAIDILHEIKERLDKVFGEEHPKTLRVTSKIAHTLGKMKKYEESLAMFDEVLSVMRKALGDEHKVTLKAKSEMSSILRNSGRYEESLVLYLEVHEIMMKVMGREHPETLSIMNDIAETLEKLERLEECLSMYNDVYQGKKAIYGEENLETIKTKKNMDLIMQRVKKT